MNKDDIRKIARLGGVPLNETLRQKMKKAESEKKMDEALGLGQKGKIQFGAELNQMGDQVIGRAVTLAIMEAEAEAQRQAEKQKMDARDIRAFVAAEVAASANDLKKDVKDTADLLHKIMLRKMPSEISKQLKEWEKFLKSQR